MAYYTSILKFRSLSFLSCKDIEIIQLSKLQNLSITIEGYTKNTACSQNVYIYVSIKAKLTQDFGLCMLRCTQDNSLFMVRVIQDNGLFIFRFIQDNNLLMGRLKHFISLFMVRLKQKSDPFVVQLTPCYGLFMILCTQNEVLFIVRCKQDSYYRQIIMLQEIIENKYFLLYLCFYIIRCIYICSITIKRVMFSSESN